MSFANLATERQRVGLWKEKSDLGPEHKKILCSQVQCPLVRCYLADRVRNKLKFVVI